MKLMLRSQANLLLSIKCVTQLNSGKRTAGVDGLTFRSTEEREWLWQKMAAYTPWVAKPARRVYIPKDKGKQRPLGIQERDGKEHTFALTQVYDTPSSRHIRVKGTFSPDDPTRSDYWRQRQTGMGKVLLARSSKLYHLAQRQGWQGDVCREHLFNGEALQTHHKQSVKDGGGDELLNLELVHKACHNHRHAYGRRLEPDDG